MTSLYRFLIILVLSCTGLYAYAQTDAYVSLVPQNPEPYQEVTITLTSYLFDAKTATITWKNGNTTLLSGLGARQIKVRAGNVGEETSITYTAVTATGESVTGSVTVSPQFINMLYESIESYTPPFYEGRTLPAEGAKVRVVAFPLVTESRSIVPASNLSYNWYVNGEFFQSGTGVNGSTAIVPLDYLTNSTAVKVVVRTPKGTTSEKTIAIYPYQAMPLLYIYDEILGTDYSKTFVGRMEISKDITLALEPFYLSTKGTLEKTTTYSWYIDGLPVTPYEKTILSLKPKPDSVGVRTLSVVIENTKRLLQKAQSDVEIIFDTRK